MKSFTPLLLLLAITPISSPAQITRGTIGVIYYTSTKIIMAADSRSTDMDDAQNDAECKIAALGKNMIFVGTGVSGFDSGDPRSPVPSWRSADEARRIYDRLSNKGTRQPSVAEVAKEWSTAMIRNEGLLYDHFGQDLLDAATDGILTQAMFGGASPDGSLTLISTDIVIRPDASPPISAEIGMELPPDSVGVIGQGAVFGEFFQPSSERAKKEAAQWERESAKIPEDDKTLFKMIRLIDLSIAYDQSGAVGGPIDAIQLERGKEVLWRQRKTACPAD